MNNRQCIEIDDGYRSTYMLHAYMLYHSTYKHIIKIAPCSEIIGDLMGH